MHDPTDIKALRDRLGWTQEKLAEFLGLDRSSVSRLENGQEPTGPTKKLIAQLAIDAPAPAPEAAS